MVERLCLTSSIAHVALAGREGDSLQFKTARAKIYSPGLNRLLAQAIVSAQFGCFQMVVEGTAAVQPDFHG